VPVVIKSLIFPTSAGIGREDEVKRLAVAAPSA
jgi:hypothetical protein